MNVVIGTAGHIDHGKTTLVKALTGIDADRLPEEKKRGITIDIGFAELDTGDVHASFVDVPGHEKFVKNMLAGASGIDVVMLVVAADEGVMPQTREHFNICRLLGIQRGLIVITKADLADEETLDLARLEVAELVEGSFLQDADVVVTSASNGAGLGDIGKAIQTLSAKVHRAQERRHSILPIDRSFSVKGHGAVVTGTLQYGEIDVDSNLELLPARTAARVRAIQSHGRASEVATAGRRVAINLGGVDRSSIERGMVLAEKGVFEPTQALDVELELLADALRPLRSRQRIRVHIGTSELLGRVTVLNDIGELAPGESGFVQVRLEAPTVAVHGTRLIVRSYSPQMTIAGGRVLDPMPTRHRQRARAKVLVFLSALAAPDVSQVDLLFAFIARAGKFGVSQKQLIARTGWLASAIADAIGVLISDSSIVDAGGWYLTIGAFDVLQTKLLVEIRRRHDLDPLSKGVPKGILRESLSRDRAAEIFESLLGSLVAKGLVTMAGETVSLAERKRTFSPAETAAQNEIFERLQDSELEVPKIAELLESAARRTKLPAAHVRRVLQTLIDSREVVKVSDDLFFSRAAIDQLIEKIRDQANVDRSIDVTKFKQIAGVSRKYAIPLLEYLDREKITVRTGDTRVIR